MSILSEPHFHNEAAAIARLEAIVWLNGPHCPRCGGFDRVTTVKGVRAGLRRQMKRYLSEFDFRYNERSALCIEDAQRTAKALSGIVGKRLTYRDSSAQRTSSL